MPAVKDQTVKSSNMSGENCSVLATWRFSFYTYL